MVFHLVNVFSDRLYEEGHVLNILGEFRTQTNSLVNPSINKPKFTNFLKVSYTHLDLNGT